MIVRGRRMKARPLFHFLSAELLPWMECRSWEGCRALQLWSQTCTRCHASVTKGGATSSPRLLSISPLSIRYYIFQASCFINQGCSHMQSDENETLFLRSWCYAHWLAPGWHSCLLKMLWWQCQWAHVSISSCLSFKAMKQSRACLNPFPNECFKKTLSPHYVMWTPPIWVSCLLVLPSIYSKLWLIDTPHTSQNISLQDIHKNNRYLLVFHSCPSRLHHNRTQHWHILPNMML